MEFNNVNNVCCENVDVESLVTFTQTDRQFKYRYNSERDGIYSLQFSYDANVLAVGYGDGTIEARSTCVYSTLVKSKIQVY